MGTPISVAKRRMAYILYWFHVLFYKTGKIVNDLVIPTLDEELAKKHVGKHFMIEYNIEDNEYKIKDLGIGFGVFFRLDYQLVQILTFIAYFV
jgi:hypothetical protein